MNGNAQSIRQSGIARFAENAPLGTIQDGNIAPAIGYAVSKGYTVYRID